MMGGWKSVDEELKEKGGGGGGAEGSQGGSWEEEGGDVPGGEMCLGGIAGIGEGGGSCLALEDINLEVVVLEHLEGIILGHLDTLESMLPLDDLPA